MRPWTRSRVIIAFVCLGMSPALVLADGKLVPPRDYKGSPEESFQEAVIVFQEGDEQRPAREDLILKITVHGDQLSTFAWIIPFPSAPDIQREEPSLFRELFEYVEARQHARQARSEAKAAAAEKPEAGVEVLSRKVVGSYDTAVVRETTRGALNEWLRAEGFRPLADAEDVLDFYRAKNSVFACVKVSDVALAQGSPVDLHPLRFTFDTGGRDGIYFPMKLTGLQSAPFGVNLYVFHRFWLNDHLNRYGFEYRGFHLRYRDWDSPACTPNAGKAYTAPASDPFLKADAHRFPSITAMLQKLHPGERYYLTNLQAWNLKPADVRQWSDDLWLFPYYTNRSFVPYDARPPGGDSAGIADEPAATERRGVFDPRAAGLIAAGAAGGLLGGLLLGNRFLRRKKNAAA